MAMRRGRLRGWPVGQLAHIDHWRANQPIRKRYAGRPEPFRENSAVSSRLGERSRPRRARLPPPNASFHAARRLSERVSLGVSGLYYAPRPPQKKVLKGGAWAFIIL